MKVLYYLLKTGLCLSLPIAFSLAAALVAPSPARSQTNQSDVTGSNTTTTNNNTNITTTTTIISGGSSSGGSTGGTNQSDITGNNTSTTTTISREVTISVTRIIISTADRFSSFVIGGSSSSNQSNTTTTTTTGETTSTVTLEPAPAPTGEGSSTPEIEPVALPAPESAPLPATSTPVAANTPNSEAGSGTNQSDVTGGVPTNNGNNGGPNNPEANSPAIQTLNFDLGSQQVVLLMPPGLSGVRGNGGDTLVALSNLSSIGRMRLLGFWSWGSWGGMLVRLGNQRIFISLAGLSPGSSQESPVLPDGMSDGSFNFVGVVTGAWVDPPVAEGFRYTMTSDSLFTQIEDFPTGFPTPFTVSVNGEVLGEFGPGDSVDFTQFPGGGVKEFTIGGLTPLVDPENPLAFPLKLAFDDDTADFTMSAIVDSDAVAYYEENPPAESPFAFNLMSDRGILEVEPQSTAQVLRTNADLIAASMSDSSKRQEFLTTVAQVERDLDRLGTHFKTLFPEGGGLDTIGLNPSITTVSSLRTSLPMLLEQMSDLSDELSEEQAMAIANSIAEVEGVTTLLEAVTPMLAQMSDAIAVSR